MGAKKRSDCFFGMHFDFHASSESREIGRNFDPNVLRDLLEQTQPDFVQCDTKGHAGYAGYPSEVCEHPEAIRLDILKEWRRITAEKNVLLYGHHSGVWDFLAVKMHPEWAATDENGVPSDQATSVFGAYADRKLIPQLCELAGKYGLNGAWIDGDCWGAVPDYSKAAASAWREQTGKEVPASGSPDHRAYLDFCRRGFVNYVAHYVSAVKKRFPDFEIASNWLNTSYAPVDDAVTDFISGDMATTECADSARFEARVIADYHRPWDLMAWGFYPKNRNLKSANQLCQELALVFSVGGGVQTYFSQDYLSVIRYPDVVINTMRRVAEFCRARRACSYGATAVPTVGVVFSAQAFFKNKERVFADWEGLTYNSGVRGMTNLILENGCPTEILRASTLAKRDLTGYSLLVLTECPDLEKECEDALLRYAEQGGTLVLSGVETLKRFAPLLDLKIKEGAQPIQTALRKKGGVEFYVDKSVELTGACTPVEQTETFEKDGSVGRGVSLWRVSYGSGSVWMIGFNAGLQYFNNHSFVLRQFMGDLLDRVSLPLRGFGSYQVTMSLMQKEGKELIHLVNMNGDGRSAHNECFDEITPVRDYSICYRTSRKPRSIRAVPSGEPVEFSYKNGAVTFVCRELNIHTCFEISYEKG